MTEAAPVPPMVSETEAPPAPEAFAPDGRPFVVEQANALPVWCARCKRWVKAGHAISRGEWDDDPRRAKPRREWTQRCKDEAACIAHASGQEQKRQARLKDVKIRLG